MASDRETIMAWTSALDALRRQRVLAWYSYYTGRSDWSLIAELKLEYEHTLLSHECLAALRREVEATYADPTYKHLLTNLGRRVLRCQLQTADSHLQADMGSCSLEESIMSRIRLHNEFASTHGFNNYFEMVLSGEGIPYGLFGNLVASLEEVGLRALMELVLSGQFLPRQATASIARAGRTVLSQLRTMLSESSRKLSYENVVSHLMRYLDHRVSEYPAKIECSTFRFSHPGVCLAVEPPRDVRVLLNRRGITASHPSVLHELGHGFHLGQVDPTWGTTVQDFELETMAQIFGHLACSTDYWESLGLSSKSADSLSRLNKAALLLTVVDLVLTARFQLEVYRLSTAASVSTDILSRAYERVFGESLGIESAAGDWIGVSTFSYRETKRCVVYLMADVLASQIAASLATSGGLGGLAAEYFAPGGPEELLDLVERNTGHPISSRSLCWLLGDCQGGERNDTCG